MGSTFGTHEGALIWLNSEPCGLICGMMTWLLLGYGMGATTYSVIVPWMGYSIFGCLHIFCFNFLSLLAMYCHMRAMTVDPGSVPNKAMPSLDDDFENDVEAVDRPNKFRRFCKRCKAFKPVRAHHCSICRRCVVKMDHHCPWVNNCVGIGNQKLFLLFILFTSIVCGYSLVLVMCRFAACAFYGGDCGAESHFLFILFLFLESLLFLLFTLCMLGDQLSSLHSNQTSIDKLKNQKHEIRVDVNEVCGSPIESRFQINWFIPIAVSFSEAVRERVMGYRMSASSSGDYLLSLNVSHGREEVTPLMDDATESKGVELNVSDSMNRERKMSTSKDGNIQAVPLPTPSPSTIPVPSSWKQLSISVLANGNEDSTSDVEEEGDWMAASKAKHGKQQANTGPEIEIHSHSSNNNNNSNMRKRAGPP